MLAKASQPTVVEVVFADSVSLAKLSPMTRAELKSAPMTRAELSKFVVSEESEIHSCEVVARK